MDFLRNRTFRQTLLCHQGQPVSFAIDGGRIAGMHAASRAVPASTPDLASRQADRFTGPDNASVSTREPLLKAALLELAGVWPATIPFEELYERAALRMLAGGGSLESGQPRLGSGLAVCYLGGLVDLLPRAHVCTVRPTARPIACPLARLQASRGANVTNRRHERLKMNDTDRHLLTLLDGNRNHEMLVNELAEACVQGVLTARHEGQPVRDPSQVRQIAQNALPGLLSRLGSLSLLIG
jgi:methyltransferase-like protein